MATAHRSIQQRPSPMTLTGDVVNRSSGHCQRCRGLLVVDHCLQCADGMTRGASDALRCVQCGDVIDAVILRNREAQGCAPPSHVGDHEMLATSAALGQALQSMLG